MQNVTNSMNISVYVDGNDVMFLFKGVTEEQKKQLLVLANEVCNAGVNTFTTLKPKEKIEEPVPDAKNMQLIVETKPVVAGDAVDVTKSAKEVVAETKETGVDIYAMTKEEATQYLIKNIDSGVFVGYDNLIRAYFVAKGKTKAEIEPKFEGKDFETEFKKGKKNIDAFVNAAKGNDYEFES